VLAGLPSSCERSYPDHGATHRFIWRGPGKENALKSYVAFDVSYWPQMMLVASRGDFDERYALRLAAYKKQWQSQTDQEETAPTDARKFLSRKDASSPWLPLPSQ
jgi:phage-related protein